LDPSANTKVIEHHKSCVFYIWGFASQTVGFGLICEKEPHAFHMPKGVFGLTFGFGFCPLKYKSQPKSWIQKTTFSKS
jgi:hypothetical protein